MEIISRYYDSPIAQPKEIPVELPPLTTVAELITLMQIPEEHRHRVVVLLNDDVLEVDYEIQDGDNLTIGVVPGGGGGGGKQIIGLIATIAIAVAAPYLAPMVASAINVSGTLATTLITAGITMVGSLVIGALIPPPALNLGGTSNQQQADDVYFVTGQSNQMRLYETVSVLYGTHKIFPDLAATPRVKNVGVESKISMLLDLGPGDVDVEQVNVADTLASNLGLTSVVHSNTKDPALQYVTDMSANQSFKMAPDPVHWQYITTAPSTTGIEVMIQLPRGLFEQRTDGSVADQRANIEVQYQKLPSGPWTYFPNAMTGGRANYDQVAKTLIGQSLEPFIVLFSADGLAPGDYYVRFRGNFPDTNVRIQNGWELVNLGSFKAGKPVKPTVPHTFLEVHGVASEKLSGQIQTLNVLGHKKIRDITATGFTGPAIRSSNPALIALDILTCPENPQPLKDAQIDFASFKELRDICAGNKFTYNSIMRREETVKEKVNEVLGNARAQMNIMASGKIGVLIDKPGRVPKQLITPANSWGFSGTRMFPYYPDALRVSYTEPRIGYDVSEVVVYHDGKNEANSEFYEDLATIGITNYDEAWRYGRFMMAQSRMRNETFTVNMDIEHLAVTRGDVVSVQHDVPKFGGLAARVVSAAGTFVTIDQEFTNTGALGARIRLADGTIVTRTATKQTANTVALDSPVSGLDYGDLIVLGQIGRETRDYIVLAVEPDASMSAALTLVPYVPEVYAADTGAIPPWDPGLGNDLISGTDLKVDHLVGTYSIEFFDRLPVGKVELTWGLDGNPGALKYYNIVMTLPGGQDQVIGTVNSQTYSYSIDLPSKPGLHNKDATYTVTPVNTLGIEGTSASTVVRITPDTTPPHPVAGYAVNVTNNSQIDIFWQLNKDQDVDYYDLRYSPQMSGAIFRTAVRLARVSYTTDRVTVGARTGTYFIVAVDTSGNKSRPTQLHTSVEKLPNLDVIETIDEAGLNWPGTMQNMVLNSGGSLSLAGNFGSVVPQGYYVFNRIFSAGDIQELRLQAKILAYGVAADDIMSKWIPLSSVPALSRADTDQFNAWMEVRTADSMSKIADWPTLDDVSADPISKGSLKWNPWRRFESSDVTGRLFQFRLAAESSNPNFNIVVASSNVEIDVLERYESYPDLNITNPAGLRIDFNPPFRAPPSLAVTIDGNSESVRYEVLSKTKYNATIQLLTNATPGVGVTGKVDVSALGWGRIRTQPL